MNKNDTSGRAQKYRFRYQVGERWAGQSEMTRAQGEN